MDRGPPPGGSLETEQLRSLGRDERLILREDGALVLDDDGTWGDVEIVDLEDEVTNTIDLDLDDTCVIRVEEEAAPAPTVRGGAAPPPPERFGPPSGPVPAPPPRSSPQVPSLRPTPLARIKPVRDPKRAALKAIAAGDFAGAQSALGHSPRRRSATKPLPHRKPSK